MRPERAPETLVHRPDHRAPECGVNRGHGAAGETCDPHRGPPVQPIRVQIHRPDLRGVDLPQVEGRDRADGEAEELELGEYMRIGVGFVVHFVGQQPVEKIRPYPDRQARGRPDPHRDQHVPRWLPGADAGIVGEEGEVGDLDARVFHHPGRGEEHDRPDPAVVLLQQRRHDHALRHEGVEEGDRRDRQRADDAERGGHRHRLVEPAQLRRLRLPRHVHDRTHGHEEQPLEEHVVEGVGDGPVDGQGGPHPDPADHEADLVDHRVTQGAPQVVFDHGVEDREARHDGAGVDEHLLPRVPPCQGVHGHLGGECAQEDGAGGGALGVGVDQPAVGEREGGLDPEGQEDQPPGQPLQPHLTELEAPGFVRVHHGAGE